MAIITEELTRRTRVGRVDVQVKFTDTNTGEYVKKYIPFNVDPTQAALDAMVLLVKDALIQQRRQQENSWNSASEQFINNAWAEVQAVWNFIPKAIVADPTVTGAQLAARIDQEFPDHIIDLSALMTRILDRTRFNNFADLKTYILANVGDIQER